MKEKGQLSLDIIFGLILFIIILGAMQPLTLNAYANQNKTGVLIHTKLMSIGLANAATSKQILNTPNSTSDINTLIPRPTESYYLITGCRAHLEDGFATFDINYTSGTIATNTNQKSQINFYDFNATQKCRKFINLTEATA
ncbi:MAG: hypothetical protein GOV15_02305 [Candidatus Diapherotrites archaeon]|nr:hypothetical protein [Candidatus Diapherotrites archaeon]